MAFYHYGQLSKTYSKSDIDRWGYYQVVFDLRVTSNDFARISVIGGHDQQEKTH